MEIDSLHLEDDARQVFLAAPAAEPERQYYFMEQLHRMAGARAEAGDTVLTYQVETFGCQMNFRDSEKMAGILLASGFTEENGKHPDLVLINTCTVRENADERVYGHLGYLKKQKERNPEMVVVLCGCMMQEPHVVETLKKSYGFVDLVFGTHNIYKLAELLFLMYSGRKWQLMHPVKKNGKYRVRHEMLIDIAADADLIVEELPDERKYPFKASVNITYGCDNFCTYCIVPYVRGRERSRRPEDILSEIRKLASLGVTEIMLLGQNVNSYGKQFEGVTFYGLLQEIEKIDGIHRIRFMTPHPKDFPDELIDVIAASDKICHHIHLPLQSGSTEIIRRMNRHYTKESYLDLVRRIREKIPDAAITTDIIVGFPGETEEDFLDTLDVVRKAGFNGAYMFEYSKRTGTPAATMPDQVPEAVVKERFARLMETVQEAARKDLGDLTGSVQEVLVEEVDPDRAEGVTGRLTYNTLVHFPAPEGKNPEELIGSYLPVRLVENCGFYYIGVVA